MCPSAFSQENLDTCSKLMFVWQTKLGLFLVKTFLTQTDVVIGWQSSDKNPVRNWLFIYIMGWLLTKNTAAVMSSCHPSMLMVCMCLLVLSEIQIILLKTKWKPSFFFIKIEIMQPLINYLQGYQIKWEALPFSHKLTHNQTSFRNQSTPAGHLKDCRSTLSLTPESTVHTLYSQCLKYSSTSTLVV